VIQAPKLTNVIIYARQLQEPTHKMNLNLERSSVPQVSLPNETFSTGGEQGTGDEITLLGVWRVLRKKRKLVAVIAALGLAAGILLACLPSTYLATGSIQVRPGSADMYKVDPQKLLEGTDSDDKIESEVTILQSRTLYSQLIDQLDLVHNPIFAKQNGKVPTSPKDLKLRSDIIDKLQHMIKVERTPKTEILTISCKTVSPVLSAKIVNALVNDYIEWIFKTRFASTQRVSGWLTGQLDDLKKQVEKNQDELVELQGRLGVVGFDQTHNLITASLEDSAKANGEASIERIVAEARFRTLASTKPELIEGGPPMLAPPGAVQNIQGSLLQNLRNSQAQLASQYAQLKAQYGPNYPDVKQAKAQLGEIESAVSAEQARVLSEAQVAYAAAKKNEDMTTAAFNKQKADAFRSRDDMVKYEILTHEYEANRTLYEGLLERLREAGIVSGLESSEVDVVDMADVPMRPSGLPRFALILISVFFGLTIGSISALVVESLDGTVHNIDDLEAYIKLPALAVLPNYQPGTDKRKQSAGSNAAGENSLSNRLEVLAEPRSQFSEGIRTLRTSILLSHANRLPKVLLFTSAVPSEGKSTVSSNTACVFAQHGAKVLLIDADLRRPTQCSRFGLSSKLGLSNYLVGSATVDDVTFRIPEVPNLYVIPSGPVPPSASLLIGSDSMTDLIRTSAEEYDYVLLDSPPAMSISDSTVVGRLSDVIILVVRDGVSTKKTILRARNLLYRSGTSSPGFVFNGVDAKSSEYYDYYGYYGYAGAYGNYDPVETLPTPTRTGELNA
jgi:polysaccharide biosynthesis transport protein